MRLAAFAALATLAACQTVPALADAPSDHEAAVLATAAKLAEAGKSDDVGLKFVEDLTTEIGPRLGGSPDEARARDWAVARLEAMGFTNVRVDDFTVPYWKRTHETLRVVGANAQPLVITALGAAARRRRADSRPAWSASTRWQISRRRRTRMSPARSSSSTRKCSRRRTAPATALRWRNARTVRKSRRGRGCGLPHPLGRHRS